jgi:hypothetical protein
MGGAPSRPEYRLKVPRRSASEPGTNLDIRVPAAYRFVTFSRDQNYARPNRKASIVMAFHRRLLHPQPAPLPCPGPDAKLIWTMKRQGGALERILFLDAVRLDGGRLLGRTYPTDRDKTWRATCLCKNWRSDTASG